jgi:deoxyribodipyrimidine photolyase
MPVIHWFRRDLRLTDNTALNAAVKTGEPVIPVFILSDWKHEHRWTGAPRQEFLCGCLKSLAQNIEAAGGKLIIRRGEAAKELEKLARETKAGAIYFNRDPDPFGRTMEERVRARGCPVHAFKDAVMHEANEVMTGAGGSFRVFTPYSRIRVELSANSTAVERKSIHTYINELIWREFYMQILWHFPEVLEHEFNPKWRPLRWSEPGKDFQRWCDGETGFPIVDAGMRELNQTGCMHNRARMITAMFLTKDLHIDWRAGERYFMQRLVDGEIASNNGGWQWSARTGADAAPYFRIQNPWSQTQRFDPEGKYIKQWVPELRDVDAARFMVPPADGASIAKNHPPPMVDHAVEREVTLEMFR